MNRPIITVKNKYLSFEGYEEEAVSFIEEVYEAYRVAGMDMCKTLNDFVFALEVAVERA